MRGDGSGWRVCAGLTPTTPQLVEGGATRRPPLRCVRVRAPGARRATFERGAGRQRADRLRDRAPRLFELLLVRVGRSAFLAVGIVGTLAEAVVREVAQLLFDRGQPFEHVFVAVIHRGPPA